MVSKQELTTFESSFESRTSWNGIQFGDAFEIFEAADEKYLEVAMVVLLKGTLLMIIQCRFQK